MMFKKNILPIIGEAGLASFILAVSFMLLEPTISSANTTSQMTESLTINKEVSFSTPTSNIVLSPAIGGLSGGIATGKTSFSILSNDTAGYSVTITASSSLGMIGNASSSNVITAYKPAAPNVPDYTFAVNNASGVAFGYTVDATTSTDLAPAFLTNNSNACNTGSTDPALAHCWLNASTTAFTIINRTQPTFSGAANYMIAFQTTVNANPNPIIPNDTYVATTTLTATVN